MTRIASKLKRTKSGIGSVLKGNTGEFYALAELSRRGWTAAQTPRNARAYDILARKGTRQVAIRVKTKTSDAFVFPWNAKKDGTMFQDLGPDDYCILVDLPANHDEIPKFYVLLTPIINEWLVSDFADWVTTPGKIKEQRNPDNKRRLLYVDDKSGTAHGYLNKLAQYRSNWVMLERKSRV